MRTNTSKCQMMCRFTCKLEASLTPVTRRIVPWIDLSGFTCTTLGWTEDKTMKMPEVCAELLVYSGRTCGFEVEKEKKPKYKPTNLEAQLSRIIRGDDGSTSSIAALGLCSLENCKGVYFLDISCLHIEELFCILLLLQSRCLCSSANRPVWLYIFLTEDAETAGKPTRPR